MTILLTLSNSRLKFISKGLLFTLLFLTRPSLIFSQKMPDDNFKAIHVKLNSKPDLDKDFFVICDSIVRKYEIPEHILILEENLKKFGFKVTPNLQINEAIEDNPSSNSDEYYNSNTFNETKPRKISNNDVNARIKIPSFYVLSYSISQIKDVGIDHYLFRIVIYERDSKKIIAVGEAENSHGRIRKIFSKYVRWFFEDLVEEIQNK
jgi:hypothetical protein